MPAVTKLGSSCSGHSCFPPRPNVAGSGNVFINGISAHRQSDGWATHCCGKSCHDAVLASGSSTVYCNDLQLCRIGDPVSCGSVAASGSQNVFAGG